MPLFGGFKGKPQGQRSHLWGSPKGEAFSSENDTQLQVRQASGRQAAETRKPVEPPDPGDLAHQGANKRRCVDSLINVVSRRKFLELDQVMIIDVYMFARPLFLSFTSHLLKERAWHIDGFWKVRWSRTPKREDLERVQRYLPLSSTDIGRTHNYHQDMGGYSPKFPGQY